MKTMRKLLAGAAAATAPQRDSSAGQRISVSGCANLGDVMAPYVPPPAYYAPMPEDYPPPPPPPVYVPPPPPLPNVNVCANVGRRISVSGCI